VNLTSTDAPVAASVYHRARKSEDTLGETVADAFGHLSFGIGFINAFI
jgi:hypothetical protein